MSAIEEAYHKLEYSNGNVSSEEDRQALRMQALILAVLAVAESLDSLNEILWHKRGEK